MSNFKCQISNIKNALRFTLCALPFNQGQSLVELLITIALAAILLPALLTGLVASRNGKAQQDQRLQAVALMKEAQEAVRVVRENDWTSFATFSGTLHPVLSGNTWSLASGSETINGFTRQIVVSSVNRNSSGTIVTSGGTLDPSTEQVVSTVSWNSPLPSSVSETTYVTRFADQNYREALFSDFIKGATQSGSIAITSAGGGQVELGSGGIGGSWCNPGTSVVATYDLPGQGVVQQISATTSASQDIAYTTTGGNASGDAVDGLTISHANPPVVANPSSNTEAKAYGIFVDNAGTYVYFNEKNPPDHTVRIANASDLSDVGYFDVFHATGQSIFVSGNTGYTTVGSTLYSFDVSSKTGSRPQLGNVNLAGTGNRVIVVGTNAYIATSNTTSQLQIINVANPSSMTVTKSINLGNGLGGVDVYVNSTQTYAYVATGYASGQNDFFIVDLNNTNNIYGYSTNGMNPKAITVVTGNKAILVGSGGTLYQVFDITSPGSASYCGGMSPSGVTSISGIAPILQSNGNAFSYIITDNSSAEFQVIAGGNGATFSTSGVFESQTFTATTEAMFNSFTATTTLPSQTTLQFRVAIKHGISNSCNGVSFADTDFVGTDGTSGTYFPAAGGILPTATGNPTGYENPGRCMRYRAYLSTTDPSQSPVLSNITFNYSP